MPEGLTTYAAEALADPWEENPPILLDGVLERQRFAPVLTALLALVGAFILFQGISAVVTLVLLLAQGVALERLASDLPALLGEQAGLIITGNTLGQVIGLALPAYLLARLHSRRGGAFLRVRVPDARLLVLGVVGLVALTPVVQWLGVVNEAIPLPQALRDWDQSQMELIEQILLGDLGMWFSLAMLAVTPALCEELIFRGYVQRQAERSFGAAGGILLSGVVFGAYHLRFTQVIPLSLLGIYLAFLAWRTGSLWVPILVHFLNNALAVAAAEYVQNRPDLDIAALEELQIPWYLVVAGLALTALTVYAMRRRAETLLRANLPSNVSEEHLR